MSVYEMLPVSGDEQADFAIVMEDDALSPLYAPGSTVRMKRSTDLLDGDVGLFYSKDGIVFRQFCQDSQGNIYLFCPDRTKKEKDLMIPAAAERPVCYGKVLLDTPLPLPED